MKTGQRIVLDVPHGELPAGTEAIYLGPSLWNFLRRLRNPEIPLVLKLKTDDGVVHRVESPPEPNTHHDVWR